MKDRPFGECRLPSAGATLEDLHRLPPVKVVLFDEAPGTLETLWPAGILKDCFALFFMAKFGEKLVQTDAFLKLNSVHLHDWPP